MAIDLTAVKALMERVDELIEDLDGQELDEQTALEDQSKGRDRRERARLSQSLNLLGDRLALAASLARNEYWVARGESDPFNVDR